MIVIRELNAIITVHFKQLNLNIGGTLKGLSNQLDQIHLSHHVAKEIASSDAKGIYIQLVKQKFNLASPLSM